MTRFRAHRRQIPEFVAGLFFCLGLILVFLPRPALAGVDDILEAIRQSEFRFIRTAAEVPFIPLGWAQYHYYPGTEFRDERGTLPSAQVAEHTAGLGAVVPVHVSRRDMILLGGDLTLDSLRVLSGPYADQRVVRLIPVAVWMHQFGRDETVGMFAAPVFSKELSADQPWAVNGFGGVIGMHWSSDTLQWVYGGVYEYNFGAQTLYPYLGMQWVPTPKLSLALLFPWPTMTYTPAERWLWQLGITPGGSSWVSRDGSYENVQSFGSWNLSAGVAYRLSGPFWLYAGAGVTGYRGLTSQWGEQKSRLDAQSSPVYTLAIQFRP